MKEYRDNINKLLEVILSIDEELWKKQIERGYITIKQLVQFNSELQKFINKLNT